jgi:hypothetical protein
MQVLEQRFHQAIEPAVSAALAARQADRVADLARLMADAGRAAELEGLYVASRLPMLQVTHLLMFTPFSLAHDFKCGGPVCGIPAADAAGESPTSLYLAFSPPHVVADMHVLTASPSFPFAKSLHADCMRGINIEDGEGY